MSDYIDKRFDNDSSNHGWYTCVRCGKKFRKDDIDHIIPQSYGGGDDENNLQCMCKHCKYYKEDYVDPDTVNVNSDVQEFENLMNEAREIFKNYLRSVNK